MKVITFSRTFPATHPRKGVCTFFPELILKSQGVTISDVYNLDFYSAFRGVVNDFAMMDDKVKNHTIRAGKRWKVGDWFSPRIWSGKPYASKQMEFSKPVQIKRIWDFDIARGLVFINRKCFGYFHPFNTVVQELAKNDGLDPLDMTRWFSVHPKAKNLRFSGQILCWNENIKY